MDKYYVVKSKAIPEALLKVVEAKKLLESGKAFSAKEAADMTGISRSTFYKYRDDIMPFDDHSRGKTITASIAFQDEPGSLVKLLKIVAARKGNILTIHQSIPVGGIATISLSVEVPRENSSVSGLVDDIEHMDGIKSVKILAGE